MADHASNPFAERPGKEGDELEALARALGFANGFSLVLARVSTLSHARRLEQNLSERLNLDMFRLYRLELTEPIDNLLLRLREIVEQACPSAISVSGLEHSFPDGGIPYQAPLALHLNAARNSFYAAVPCPLLIWAQDKVISALAHGAPDFFSIRSGVYSFTEEDEDFTALLAHIQSEQDLSPAILRHMSDRMNSLSSRADRAVDLRLEAEIYWHLGSGYRTLGPDYFSIAEENIEQALLLAEKNSLPDVACKARLTLGGIALERRRPSIAAEHFSKVADQSRQANLPREECLALIGWAGVLEATGDLLTAVELYDRALRRARDISDQALIDRAQDGLQRARNQAGPLASTASRGAEYATSKYSPNIKRTTEPLQLLFLFSRKRSSGRMLSADREYSQIEKALNTARYGHLFKVHIVSVDTPDDLARSLWATKPHIVHFYAVDWPMAGFDVLYRFRDETYRKLHLIVIQAPDSNIDLNRLARFAECTIFLGDARSENMAWAFYRGLGDGLTVMNSFEMARAQLILSGFTGDEPRMISSGGSHYASPLEWLDEKSINPYPPGKAFRFPPLVMSMDGPGVRKALTQYLPLDSDFDAFVLDYFPAVFRRFTVGFSRAERTNMLISLVEPIDISKALQLHLMRGERAR